MEEILGLLNQLKAQKQLAPVCLSTMSRDGFPNSRFVDLKEVAEGRLCFGTDERSIKAREFGQHPKVGVCGWWPSLQVQVRVVGIIEKASPALSDQVFFQRSRTTQAIAAVSIQSQPLTDVEDLRRRVRTHADSQSPILRPATWWVFAVVPMEVEILRFSEDRVHLRTQYLRQGSRWTATMLSP